MIDKEIEQITENDLQRLVTNKVAENRTLDYKEELPKKNNEEKKEFYKDISSFANALGGDIIYGISEEKKTKIPIYKIDFTSLEDKKVHNKMIEMVSQMLEVQKKYHSSKTENEKNMYKKQIDILDNQIDQLVYELYGLTEEEIAIIEGEN